MSGKKVAIIGVASLFLVAMVIGVTIGINKTDKGSNKTNLSTTHKAIEDLCQPTDYKDTCVSTIKQGAPSSDSTKDLIKAAFNGALVALNNVTEHSTLFKELEKDPKTSNAVQVCKRLIGDAADDFRRSVDEIGSFDFDRMDKVLGSLKIWLSATITYQETCLDGFKDSTTEAGDKARKMLHATLQIARNGVDMIAALESTLKNLQLPRAQRRRLLSSMSSSSTNRRLMSWSDEFVLGHYNDEFLDEIAMMSHRKRRLLSSGGDSNVGGGRGEHDDDVIPRWMDVDDRRRKLLQAKAINELKPTVVVAQDGSGNYTKIADAFAKVPFVEKKKNEDMVVVPYVIFVKAGVYNESLLLDKKQDNVVLVGEGPTKTKITGNKYVIPQVKTTIDTGTMTVKGDGFVAKDLTIENTSGPERHQAVALVLQSDKSIIYNVHIDGYQDTLYAHTYRQYYRDCRVSGTIDFVFGDAAAFFQNCTFVVRKPMDNQDCIVTAQGRAAKTQPTGLIFHKCNIVADPDYYPIRFKNKAFLGRPWRECSKTILMECNIDDLINPEGWQAWNGSFGLDTCYYGEYRNEGPGANTDRRVKWRGIKTIFPTRAQKFFPSTFHLTDAWIKESGVPYIPTLTSDASKFVPPPGAVDEEPDEKRKDRPTDEKKLFGHSKNKDTHKTQSQLKEISGESSFGSSLLASNRRSLLQASNGPPSEKSASRGVVDLKKMLMQDDVNTPRKANEPLFMGALAQERTPTSAPTAQLDRALFEDDPSSGVPIESPDLVENLEKTVKEEQARSPATNDEGTSPSVLNLESELMREESPTSAPSAASSPWTKAAKPGRAMLEEDPSARFRRQSPSIVEDLEKTVLQEQARSPATNDEGRSRSPSVVNLESELMQEEHSPTKAPSKGAKPGRKLAEHDPSPSESPSSSDGGGSPSSVINLKSALMHEGSPTSAPISEGPSETAAKLDRTLMQDKTVQHRPPPNSAPNGANNDNVNDEDVEDDHDKLVTPMTAKADSILETLHLKSRSMLSLDGGGEALSISKRDGGAANNNPQLAEVAQLASSPDSKNFLANALAQENGTSLQGAASAPNANEVLAQLGMNGKPTAAAGDKPPAGKSGSSGRCEVGFGFSVVAVLLVLLVGV